METSERSERKIYMDTRRGRDWWIWCLAGSSCLIAALGLALGAYAIVQQDSAKYDCHAVGRVTDSKTVYRNNHYNCEYVYQFTTPYNQGITYSGITTYGGACILSKKKLDLDYSCKNPKVNRKHFEIKVFVRSPEDLEIPIMYMSIFAIVIGTVGFGIIAVGTFQFCNYMISRCRTQPKDIYDVLESV